MKKIIATFGFFTLMASQAIGQYTGYYTGADFPRQISPRPSIVYYAKKGNLNALKMLQEQGYSVDAMDSQGNTPLCDAVIQQDSLAMQTLLKAGANPQASCMQKIPAFQKELLKTVPNLSLNPSSTAITALDLGLVASAAVIGGGVALAASGGGGGGGGSSDDSTPSVISCTTSQYYDGGVCLPCPAHSSSAGGQVTSCTCDEGWTGANCENKNSACTGNTTSISNCSSQTSCKYGDQTLYTCATCNTGYTGEKCDSCASGYDKYGTGTCHLTKGCNTSHGSQKGDSCQCNPGWTGDDTCNTATTCGANYKPASLCGDGYHTTANTCQSGDALLTECLENTCDGYEVSCPKIGYTAIPACLKGKQQYYSCMPNTCGEGYNTLGTTCTTGYHQEGESCVSGTNTYIKCVINECSGYSVNCSSGFHSVPGNTCQHGSTLWVKCEENACVGYTEGSCPANAKDCDTCQRGAISTYKFTECKAGWEGDTCNQKKSCGYTTTSCSGGYVESGNTCQSGDTIYKECVTKECVGYSTSCNEGYYAVSGDTCQSGDQTLLKCAENECTGKTVGKCPENAEGCETCWRGTTETYSFSKCKEGWTGSTCSESISCGEGYVLNSCPEHASCSKPCQSGNDSLIKITACDTNYELNATKTACIFSCPANQYAQGESCYSCPTGSTSSAGSVGISSCQCASGYAIKNNKCVQVDFVNLEKHPGGIKTAAQYSAESEFIKGNFLNQINAQFAYEHGYNGSITNMDQDGNVLLTENKVKVGVIDNYLDVNNPDITSNLITETVGGTTKAVGINFDYGPCRGDDKTNCYALLKNEEKTNKYGQDVFDIVFYKTETDYQLVFNQSNDSDYSKTNYKATFDTAFRYYSSTYDWDTDTKYNVGTTSNTSFDSQSNTSEQDHGTHVTGIIAALNNASGMQGVVPNSEILFTQAHSVVKGDYFQGKWFESAMQNYADSGVKVINMSIGGGKTSYAGLIGKNAYDVYPYYQVKAMEIAAQNNIVTVHSAGNDGNNKEAELDSAYTLTSTFNGSGTYDLTNLNISVTSVDKNDKLASYSQICGSTKSFCISAPGGDIDRGKTLFRQSSEYISRNNALEEEESTLTEYRNAYYNATTDEEKEAARLEYNNRVSAYNNSVTEFNNWVSSETKKVIQEWGIYSTVKTDYTHTKESDGSAYGYMQGTSMAAPVVTGSVALLMSAYPYLTSQQVVEILFRSANKNLEGWGTSLYNEVEGITVNDSLSTWTDTFGNVYNISSIYGHGIVDLKAATEPLGELKTPTGKSVASKKSLTNTKLALPRTVNTEVDNSVPKTVLGLDDYNRPFATPIEEKITYAYHNPDSFKRDFKSFMNKSKIQTAGVQDKLSFAFSSTKTDQNLMGLGILDMNYQFNDSAALKFSYRSDILNENNHIDKALSNPFMNMTDSYSLAQTLKYKDLAFTFGGTVGKNAFYETNEDKDDKFKHSAHAFNTEMVYRPNKSLTFKVVGGMMQEKEALLGIHGSGVFETNDGKTYFTGAKVEYHPIVPFTLSASYYYGRSSIPKTKGLVSIDDVISDSFAFDARYQPDEKNTLGLQFSSPLRIRKGNAIFNLPVARNLYTDEVYFDEQRVSLKPKSREYDLSVYYMTESDTIDYRGELMVRLNPDHISGIKPDYRALFGLSWKY